MDKCKQCGKDITSLQNKTKPRIFCENPLCPPTWYRNQQQAISCLGCGIEFKPRPYRQQEQKFHNNACATKYLGKMKTLQSLEKKQQEKKNGKHIQKETTNNTK